MLPRNRFTRNSNRKALGQCVEKSSQHHHKDRCLPEEVNDVSSKCRDDDGQPCKENCITRHLMRRERHAPCNSQNLESETVLNGFAQLGELVIKQPSGRARVECIVLRTCRRLRKKCCDLRLGPSVAQQELYVELSLTPRVPLEVAEVLLLISAVAPRVGSHASRVRRHLAIPWGVKRRCPCLEVTCQ